MTLSDYQDIFLDNVALLLIFSKEKGFKRTGSYLKRDMQTQQMLFDKGLSKTLKSNHLRSLAIDLNFFLNGKLTYKKEDLQAVGDYWESLHELNRWGGNWKFSDTPHFEMNVKL
jgi:hypothetical protein